MKRSFFLIFLLNAAVSVFSQTADEVINKFLVASGGKEKLNGIKTLQYLQTIKMTTPVGELQLPMQFFKEKNKLFRLQASMSFGPQALSFFTVVTDTAGYIMLPAIPMLGSDGGITKMSDEDRALQSDQLDASGMFAGLVDYKTKGNEAELLKDEKVNNEDCYKIRLISKSGNDVIYYISKATNLVRRTDTKGATAASISGLGAFTGGISNQANTKEVSTLYDAYTDVQGLKFPTKVVIKNQMGDAESEISDIKINAPIEDKWYKAE
jgi:hypothetical protein